MKILMINYEFPPIGGGSANANYYLLKEFSKYPEIKLDLVTSSQEGFSKSKFSENITIYKLKMFKKNLHYQSFLGLFLWSLNVQNFLPKLINENNYNLCHAWFGWPCGFFAYQHKKRIPYLVALRGSDVPEFNSRLRILDRMVFKPYSRVIWKNAKKVVANSKGMKNLALQTWKGNIQIIPNGVDVDEFHPIKKNPGSELKIVSVGRLIERKGYKYLIEALVGLRNCELTLVGDGNKKEQLRILAKTAKVKVKFAGRQTKKQVIKHLQKADIFVLPSLNEGMSNAVLEACATGLPIITTNVGGSTELVKDNGFVVEKQSSKAIKNVLTKYFNNRTLLHTHSQNSIKIAQKYSWSVVAQEYMKVYHELEKSSNN